MSQIANSRVGEVILGKYRLESVLGVGGMGEVYKANNDLMGRGVAIKTLRPELSENQEVVQRFLREARATNVVRHPNVVDVLDVGTDDKGAPFIVVELLEGETLSQYLRRNNGAISIEEAVHIMIPVADAVGFAHSKGVVHRDLKPANVFLTTQPGGASYVPKVLDFGIAKILTSEDVNMTSTGVSLGTPTYMSPEQIQGLKSVDARTDVWALGVMLFQMIAGSPPFRGDTSGALFVAICTQEATNINSVVQNVPPSVAKVIERCLRKDQNSRYPTGWELARDLRNIMQGVAVEPTQQFVSPTAGGTRRNTAMQIPTVPTEVTGRTGATNKTLVPVVTGASGSSEKKSRAPMFIGLTVGLLALAGGGTFAALKLMKPPAPQATAAAPTATVEPVAPAKPEQPVTPPVVAVPEKPAANPTTPPAQPAANTGTGSDMNFAADPGAADAGAAPVVAANTAGTPATNPAGAAVTPPPNPPGTGTAAAANTGGTTVAVATARTGRTGRTGRVKPPAGGGGGTTPPAETHTPPSGGHGPRTISTTFE